MQQLVSMHSADFVQISAWFTEPSKVLCTQKLNCQSNVYNVRIMLYSIEYILIMIARIPQSWRIPETVKLYASFIWFHIAEASISNISQVSCIPDIVIACNLKVYIRIEMWERIAKPHNVCILVFNENERKINKTTKLLSFHIFNNAWGHISQTNDTWIFLICKMGITSHQVKLLYCRIYREYEVVTFFKNQPQEI